MNVFSRLSDVCLCDINGNLESFHSTNTNNKQQGLYALQEEKKKRRVDSLLFFSSDLTQSHKKPCEMNLASEITSCRQLSYEAMNGLSESSVDKRGFSYVRD